MSKCLRCNGIGRIKAVEFVGVDEGVRDVIILCPYCGGKGYVEQTNEEWFANLTTEEKAKVFYEITKKDFEKLRKQFYGIANDDIDAIAMWLKEKHE